MTAHTRNDATSNLNHLRRGEIYLAATDSGIAIGEYVGMEAPFGDRSIMLRNRAGTRSIALCDITAILPAAA